MTTIPLTPAMFEMLRRAGDAGPQGSVETKIMTAEGLQRRGLVTLTPVDTATDGRFVVRVTNEGRHRLTYNKAEEAPAEQLIAWRDAPYGIKDGYVRGIQLFEIARSTRSRGSGIWHLHSRVLSEIVTIPHEGYGDVDGAQIGAENLFRQFARRLGLAPTPLETWCPRCYLDAEDGSAYIIDDQGVRRCEACDAVLVVPDPPLTGGA
jgi:hypothetical protein